MNSEKLLKGKFIPNAKLVTANLSWLAFIFVRDSLTRISQVLESLYFNAILRVPTLHPREENMISMKVRLKGRILFR